MFRTVKIFSWRCRQKVPPKHWSLSTKLHGVTSNQTVLSEFIMRWYASSDDKRTHNENSYLCVFPSSWPACFTSWSTAWSTVSAPRIASKYSFTRWIWDANSNHKQLVWVSELALPCTLCWFKLCSWQLVPPEQEQRLNRFNIFTVGRLITSFVSIT